MDKNYRATAREAKFKEITQMLGPILSYFGHINRSNVAISKLKLNLDLGSNARPSTESTSSYGSAYGFSSTSDSKGSIAFGYSNDESEASRLRSRYGVDSETVLFLFSFTPKEEYKYNTSEFEDLFKRILSLSVFTGTSEDPPLLPLPKDLYKFEVRSEDDDKTGAKVINLIITIPNQNCLFGSLSQVDQLLHAVQLGSGDLFSLFFNTVPQTTSANSSFSYASGQQEEKDIEVAATLSISLARPVLEALGSMLEDSSTHGFFPAIAGGFKNLSIDLEFDDVVNFVRKYLCPALFSTTLGEIPAGSEHLYKITWSRLQNLFLYPFAFQFLVFGSSFVEDLVASSKSEEETESQIKEELIKEMPELYKLFTKLIDSVSKVKVLLPGEHNSQIYLQASDSFKTVSGLLPNETNVNDYYKQIKGGDGSGIPTKLLNSLGLKFALGKGKEIRAIFIGLDAGGKTTMLYKFKLGEVVTTIPTIGFNVETIQGSSTAGKTVEFTIWDIGGQEKIRPLWQHYYQNTNVIIFVVDSNDRERIQEARQELDKAITNSELESAPILIYCNKQDLPNAMSVAEITNHLGCHNWRSRKWYIQASCATTGDGLYEGLAWAADNI